MHPVQTNTVSTPYDTLERTIELTFSDASKQSFKYAILKKIPFFKTCLSGSFKERNKIEFKEISKDDLDLILGLFYDARHIMEILDEESLTNPDTYFHLEYLITFLFVDHAPGTLQTIIEELSVLTYPLALSLLTNYRKSKKQENETRAFFVPAIEKLIINSIYFENHEMYEEKRLSLLRNTQKRITQKIRSCRILKETIKSSSLTRFFNRIIYSPFIENEGSDEMRDILKTLLEKEKSDIAFENNIMLKQALPVINMNRALPSKVLKLSHLKAESETGQTELYLSKRCWKIYKAHTLNCLQYQIYCGARMHRTEILNPKLFAHYDLQPDLSHYFDREYKGFFNHPEVKGDLIISYIFDFNLLSIVDLESEIRGELIDKVTTLPEIMFAEKNLTPVKEKPEIIPVFLFMRDMTDEESSHFKLTLIRYWKWDEFQIAPRDIHFKILPGNIKNKDIVRIEGCLRKFNDPIRFFFKLDDFKPIILDYSIDPTPEATHRYLKELCENQNINIASKFNFFSNHKRVK